MVAHGELGRALLETASEIVGTFSQAESLVISRHDSLETVEERLVRGVHRLDEGQGVLILADMFGGTAANVALTLVHQYRVEVVTGCNLPMLLKLSSARETDSDLQNLAQLVKFYGQRNVLVASDLLKERERED